MMMKTTKTTAAAMIVVAAIAGHATALGPVPTSQAAPTTLQLDGATINVPATSDGCSVSLEAYQPQAQLPESITALSGFVALSGCEGKFLGKAVEVKIDQNQNQGKRSVQCVAKYNPDLNDFRCMSLCSEGSDMACTDGVGIFALIDQAIGSCGALPALTEAEPPVFVKSAMSMSANVLTVAIKSKRYESRQNMPAISLGNDACVPIADWQLVSSDRVNCWDEYQAQYNWSVLSSDNCALIQTPAADTTSFAGDFRVTETDMHFVRGDVIRRTTESPLRMDIVLPVWQEASTATKIFAPINGISVITSSSFDRASGNLTISVLTSVQYPFDLALNPNSPRFDGSGISSPLASPLAPISNNCNNQAAPLPCAVTSKFVLSTNDCTINGDFSYSLSLTCSSSEPDCPLNGDETVSIVVSFPGTFVCGNVSVDVDPSTLQMQIATFQDSDHSVAKAGFLFGQTVFVHTSIQSSAVDLVSASLLSARAQLAGAAPLPAPVNLMLLPSFGLTSSQNPIPTDVDFQFLVNRANFPVPTDQSRALTITAKVGVVYRNNKRAILDLILRQAQDNNNGGNVTKQAAVAVDLVSTGTSGQRPADNVPMESDASSLSIAASLLLTLTILPLFF